MSFTTYFTSGEIKMSDIRNNLGFDTNQPLSFSQLYGRTPNMLNFTSGYPTSGTLSLSNLRNYRKLNINTNGLISLIHPPEVSYPGSGSILNDIVSNNTVNIVNGYHNGTNIVLDTYGSSVCGNSNLQYPNLGTFYTISIWFRRTFDTSIYGFWVYLLDARNGTAESYLTKNANGTLYNNAYMYINGGIQEAINGERWYNGNQNIWINMTIIIPNGINSDFKLFSGAGQNQGILADVGSILIYNRILSESENLSNFNALRSLYPG